MNFHRGKHTGEEKRGNYLTETFCIGTVSQIHFSPVHEKIISVISLNVPQRVAQPCTGTVSQIHFCPVLEKIISVISLDFHQRET